MSLFNGKVIYSDDGRPARLTGGPLAGDDPRDGGPGFRITGTFGKSAGFWADRNPHSGVDLGAPKGTEIVAPADGKFVFAQSNRPSFGRWCIIEHDLDGSKVYTAYCHMDSWADWWSTKDPSRNRIRAGQTIGTVGDSGEAYGAHLHWGMSSKYNTFPKWSENTPLLNPLDYVGAPDEMIPEPPVFTPAVVHAAPTPAHDLATALRVVKQNLEDQIKIIDEALA